MTEDALPYGSLPQSDFEAQYKRVFEAAGCRTQVELASLLEIQQSSISDAKRRKNIPAEWRVKLFEKKRINPEWILNGTSAKYLAACPDEPRPHVVRVIEVRPPHECSSQDLFAELVRRAITPLDIEAIRKEAAASWRPINKSDDNS